MQKIKEYLEYISIHTPHAGSDGGRPEYFLSNLEFQSTLPMRGVTLAAFFFLLWYSDFNPHSPCGE